MFTTGCVIKCILMAYTFSVFFTIYACHIDKKYVKNMKKIRKLSNNIQYMYIYNKKNSKKYVGYTCIISSNTIYTD